MHLILSFIFAFISVIHTFSLFLFPLSVPLNTYKKLTFDHFFNRIITENMSKEILELLQQIRQVENEHNQLVDEYFKISKYKIKEFDYFLSIFHT